MLPTKTKIIDLAEHYLQRNGYDGFSYHDISSALHIKNAAIHYHFPRKEDLVKAVVLRASKRFDQLMTMSEQYDQTALSKVERFLNIYDQNLYHDHRVCLIGSLSSHLFTLPDHLKEVFFLLVEKMKSWLAEVLKTGRENGEFDYDGSAEKRAAMISSSMIGTLLLARVSGEEAYFSIKSQLLNDITK